MNEAETRAELIDPALAAAGWGVAEGSRIAREFQITTGRLEGLGRRGKAEIADYVLIYRGQRLAVIEAKKRDAHVTEGLAQAKSYAQKLAIRFTYATNGRGVYQADIETGKEGDVSGFPTPDQLWALTFVEENQWRDRFAAVPVEDKGGSWTSRYYQDIAIDRVLEAVAAKRNRILLTLATGTGKTFIAFQIAWKLFHAKWNRSGEPVRRPRILFLADRNILADQAYNAFSPFSDDARVRIDPARLKKTGKAPHNGSVFFTIFQTFMSGHDADGAPQPSFYDYAPDFFDFIIIDECHRGGAKDESNWRAILEYFSPAVQLGLTATPKRRDNVDTYAYFGAPVYIYSLREGINDGFLTPFKVRQIATTLDEYVFTHDDDVVEGEVEEGRRYTEAEFNRIIEIAERERYRVKTFMDMIDQSQKTIVFCATQDHAAAVRDLINQMKTSKDPNYCVRVTAHDGAAGEAWLSERRTVALSPFDPKLQEFLDFVLGQYIERGIDELSANKLASLLELKYHAVSDATATLGKTPQSIREAFLGFQTDLFEAILKAAIHYAEGERWIGQQPQFIMPVKSPPPRDVWLKREEVAKLIEKAKSPHIRLFIKIAVSTAARSGAILDLKWDQLDMERRIIDFGRGFGNKRRSVVPMNDEVYEALLEAKELAQTDHVIEYNSKPTRAVKKAFSRLCESCGIKASPHVLRHTAATWLVMDGVPLSEVARLLGDSEKTVERVYGKHSPDYLQRAVTALNLRKSKPVLQL